MQKIVVFKILDRNRFCYGAAPGPDRDAVIESPLGWSPELTSGPVVAGSEILARLSAACRALDVAHEIADVTGDYEFWRTSAPPDYDGFGTLTTEMPVEAADDFEREVVARENFGRKTFLRIVGILQASREWQVTRYRSGLYYCVPTKGLPE